MSTREMIHHLLYLALGDIRQEARLIQAKTIFDLADLFEPLPLQLEKVAQNNGNYEELLHSLHHRAQQKCVGMWLDR